jgi:hypothetical protein
MRKTRFSEEQIINILKGIVADLMLDNRMLKNVLAKKW